MRSARWWWWMMSGSMSMSVLLESQSSVCMGSSYIALDGRGYVCLPLAATSSTRSMCISSAISASLSRSDSEPSSVSRSRTLQPDAKVGGIAEVDDAAEDELSSRR